MNRSARGEVGTLEPGLEARLVGVGEGARRMLTLERRASPYRSTHLLEEISVRLDDGTRLELVYKEFACGAPLEGRRTARRSSKPAFVLDPLREIEVYRRLLAPARLGTPTCYGSGVDEGTRRSWLLLERIRGRELYQIGDPVVWCAVARWLATLHGRFRALEPAEARGARLVIHDAGFYRRWMRRAVEFAGAVGGRKRQGEVERLADRYDRVVERLVSLPRTLIHGDFYPSNILVQGSGPTSRVRPVDWESAALGPGLADLAALTSGRWREEERAAMSHAYYDALASSGAETPPRPAFEEGLECCRLQIGVQWLGWSSAWTPPPAQAHDWLEEACRAVRRLGL